MARSLLFMPISEKIALSQGPILTIFTVTELTSAIKAVLETNFRTLAIKGEISNFKLQSSGHLYFSMKDAGAQISAVLFRGNASQLARMPKDGDQVIAKGEISLYAPRGQYQLIIRELQFLGLGELLIKFHQLKEQLQARGWFQPERKKNLPKFPQRIGLVTSPTGAALSDMLHVLKRRFAGAHILVNPVRVQGEKAAPEIAAAIAEFNQHRLADLLIVGRGGGSIEDLWAFNEEIVARAIFESKIPIISAVGHETDFTIADWVADVRAPTPSAAAEIAVAETSHLIKFLTEARQTTRQRTLQRISQEKGHLLALRHHPLFSSPYRLLSQQIQQIDAARVSLELLKPSNRIRLAREKLTPLKERFEMTLRSSLREKKQRLYGLWEHLRSLDPNHLLKKGYSILFCEKESSIILSAKAMEPNQKIFALLHDGRVGAFVTSVEIKNNDP